VSEDQEHIDDSARYREALQKSLLTDGWEEAFSHNRLRKWVNENRERLAESARINLGKSDLAAERHFESVINNFKPVGQFDLATTDAIFKRHFDEVVQVAGVLGFQPTRPVELVTSTSVLATPFARPTADTHQLFVGLGTSTFCNYWAKAYSAIVTAVAAPEFEWKPIESIADLRTRLSRDPSGLVLAGRLSLFYGAFGTLMGFGEVQQTAAHYPYRVHLLAAMEVFALAHEYGHFLAHERNIEFADDVNLEYFCDSIGMRLSQEWGAKYNNWLAFVGIGGLVFFRAFEISELTALVLAKRTTDLSAGVAARIGRNQTSNSHPPASDRADRLITAAIRTVAADQKEQARRFAEEYDLICTAINGFVSEMLESTIPAKPESKA